MVIINITDFFMQSKISLKECKKKWNIIILDRNRIFFKEEIEKVYENAECWFDAEVIEVKNVVTMFCKNLLKNEDMRKHIQARLNAELQYILDLKTR